MGEGVEHRGISYEIQDQLYDMKSITVKITKTQILALTRMRDQEEYLTCEKGGGWWIGPHKTNGKLAINLLRLMLVKEDGYQSVHMQHYLLTSEGEKAIETGEAKLLIPDIC